MNEPDVYREFTPPAWARGAIACFWIRRGDGSAVHVLPDGCTDIVWRAGEGALVAGPDTEAWESPTRPGELMVGARFSPGAGGAALGVPLTELRNTRATAAALGLDVHDELNGALDCESAVTAVARLALSLASAAPPDQAVQAAVRRLLDPRQRVNDLAASLGFSERQLRRRFLAAVGYSPKTLQRVLRLRRFLATMGVWTVGGPEGPSLGTSAHAAARAEGLAGAAIDAGYADQAHLTRECRALTGLTPAQLAAGAGTDAAGPYSP